MADDAPGARLVALDSGGPREIPIAKDRTTVGSRIGNDAVLSHTTVSRNHAAIERGRSAIKVVDLGSTNGTFVNGKRIAKATALRAGDEVRFGAIRFAFVDTQARRRGNRMPRATLIFGAMFAASFAAAYLMYGTPGVNSPTLAPVPSVAAKPSEVPSLAAARASVSIASIASTPAPVKPRVEDVAAPPWLKRLNYYRELARLPAVTEDPALSAGDLAHAKYLVANFAGDIKSGRNLGAAMHTEDSSRPGYSAEGLTAARQSNVNEWPGTFDQMVSWRFADPIEKNHVEKGDTASWSIDEWMALPFHRPQLLDPLLKRAGFGEYCGDGVCVECINDIGGRAPAHYGSNHYSAAVVFPPRDRTVFLTMLSTEWPDPRAACANYEMPNGVAVTLQVGSFVPTKLESFRLVREGNRNIIEACGFDSASYSNAVPSEQELVRQIMRGFGEVVILPRHPLEGGATYEVNAVVNGVAYKWSFSIDR